MLTVDAQNVLRVYITYADQSELLFKKRIQFASEEDYAIAVEFYFRAKCIVICSKLGENIVIKKLNYESQNGVFFQKYLHNAISENAGKIGVLLSFEVNDFNEQVDLFSKQLCMHIAAATLIFKLSVRPKKSSQHLERVGNY